MYLSYTPFARYSCLFVDCRKFSNPHPSLMHVESDSVVTGKYRYLLILSRYSQPEVCCFDDYINSVHL